MDRCVDEWKRVIDINLRGRFVMCQGVIGEMMKEEGGKIVKMS
ncbi:SDR family NAD(P)-dependent oxidoreductase [Bacillus altitudinis]|nr:SDR family NAD(P)-dependent oxidoreductase [Bacillus altitudinis]